MAFIRSQLPCVDPDPIRTARARLEHATEQLTVGCVPGRRVGPPATATSPSTADDPHDGPGPCSSTRSSSSSRSCRSPWRCSGSRCGSATAPPPSGCWPAPLFFYGWWSPRHVVLLLFSIAFNYAIGMALARVGRSATAGLAAGGRHHASIWACWPSSNMPTSSCYTLSGLPGVDLAPLGILLPIGISFYTFTQIAFLVDASRGEAEEYDPVHYALFVTYFPHLIAGPILHHKEMMPQFKALVACCACAPTISPSGSPSSSSGCSRRWCWPTASPPSCLIAFAPGQRARRWPPPGPAPWPTRSSSTSTSPATATWRSACRGCSASICR